MTVEDILRCWRCNTGLNVVRPPEKEDTVIRCRQCKRHNVIRAGQKPEPEAVAA